MRIEAVGFGTQTTFGQLFGDLIIDCAELQSMTIIDWGSRTPPGSIIVVYAMIRDPEARARLRQLLDDLPGGR